MIPEEDGNWLNYQTTLSQIKIKRGNGTELISLYVPETKRISDIVQRLRDEISGSGNIKSKQTRTDVQRALKEIEYIMNREKGGIFSIRKEKILGKYNRNIY